MYFRLDTFFHVNAQRKLLHSFSASISHLNKCLRKIPFRSFHALGKILACQIASCACSAGQMQIAVSLMMDSVRFGTRVFVFSGNHVLNYEIVGRSFTIAHQIADDKHCELSENPDIFQTVLFRRYRNKSQKRDDSASGKDIAPFQDTNYDCIRPLRIFHKYCKHIVASIVLINTNLFVVGVADTSRVRSYILLCTLLGCY